VVAGVVAGLAATPAVGAAPSDQAGGAPTDSIVVVAAGHDPAAVASSVRAAITHEYGAALTGFSATLSAAQVAKLRSDPRVVEVAADHRVAGSARGQPKALSPIEQIPQIVTREARRVGLESSPTARVDGKDQHLDVGVAIIDSGIQPDQPDLRVAGGVDCTGEGSGYADLAGHGTEVAGIVGAVDNGIGIVGIAPGVRLYAVRVLSKVDLGAEDSNLLCGIDWVTAHRREIQVANMSLAGPGRDDGHCGRVDHDVVHLAICRSVAAGITYVAGAGNDAIDAGAVTPAAYREVITVSGLADSDGQPGGLGGPTLCGGYADDTFAPFSNFGRVVDLAAPADCVSTTYIGSDVATDSGTSFATPFVSGAAALYLARHRGASPAEVESALRLRRERVHLPGDPDGIDEGVLNVAGL
jgi:subtilisin